MNDQRSHAVVLGASLAGLLAARVLADSYHTVTVVERDVLPEIGRHRKGVPHGRHVHGLHPRGREILEELFLGITADLVAAGAELGDVLGNVRWQLSGYTLAQADIGLPGLMCSRPLLEGHVRARVRALPGVTLLEGFSVAEPTTTPDRARVTGVRLDGCRTDLAALDADLVVDATGRGSRTPAWLAGWGYPAPPVNRVEVGLRYATRTYRLRPGALRGDLLIATARTPSNEHGGVLAAMEGDRHLVSLSGICGEQPPTDPAGFLAFARSLATPDIGELLADGEPLDDPLPFRFPASVRHRYERLRRFPDRLLVIGDAVCSFNPVYGQGITVAATQAMALRRLLADGDVTARSYFREIAKAVEAPWQIAAGGDLAIPSIPGRRPARVRLANAYLPRLHAAAARDTTLGAAFVRTVGLIDPPQGLMRPDRVLRVMRARLRAPSPSPATTDAEPTGAGLR